MSISTFQPSISYIGNGLTAAYTFPFLIQALSQLLVYETDGAGNILQTVRGTDTTLLISSVTFDSINGAGTVTLLADLPNGYTLNILQANDAPTQPSIFRNQGSFTLALFEAALDWIGAITQRLGWLSQRSVRLHDLDLLSNFNPVFPPGLGVIGAAGQIPVVNALGTAWLPIAQWWSLVDAAAVTAASLSAAASAATATSEAAASTASAVTAAASATAAAASAVTAAASATSAAARAIRANVVNISSGVSSIAVVYSSTFTVLGVPVISVINTVDANPIALGPIITSWSATGFTATFVAPTDTSNYQLSYQTSGVV